MPGQRVEWIEHRGKDILFADLSDTSEDESIGKLDKIEEEMVSKERVLLLINLKNAPVTSSEVREEAKKTIERIHEGGEDGPVALYELSGLLKNLAKTVLAFSDVNVKVLGGEKEAKDWLVSQKKEEE